MKFHPIKHKQPTLGGDARCALYALANLFDDRAFLLFNNVGESTDHNREVEFLNAWAKTAPAFQRIPAKNIYPHAITPPDLPIQHSKQYEICEVEGAYIPVLLDVASDVRNVYHTVLALWGKGNSVVIDSKKDFPQYVVNSSVFEAVRVHGFRIICAGHPDKTGATTMVYLTPEDLPHIFNIES